MTLVVKIWRLLTPSERRSAVGLVGLMLASMLFEMLSIGLVMPALAAMTADSSVRLPEWLQGPGSPLGSLSGAQIILAGLAVLFGIYLVKTVFLLFAGWQQVSFVARLQERIGRTLFATYLTQPWTFHLHHNSATLIRNIAEIPALAHTCMSMLLALTEALILAGILGLLFCMEPQGAVAVGLVMAAATWVLERLTRHRLVRWGALFQLHNGLAYKQMLEGFGGAKEIKLLGCEGHLIDLFSRHRRIQVAMQARQFFFSVIPRLWYELLAVGALCVLTSVLVWQGKTTQAMIPVLGLFGAAAFRILPSANRLASAIQTLRYSTAVVDTVKTELALGQDAAAPPHHQEPFRFAREIALDEVCYRYPGSDALAIERVSLVVPHGGAIGLIGGSGAGKSTLVDIILGLLTPSSGRITVDGVDTQSNVRGWQRLIGYVPQSIYLCDDTIRRNVAFGLPDDHIDDAAVTRALRAAQLDSLISSLPEGVNTVVGERGTRLSGGQRQRIGIARALYHDPAVLVLDEATSALDHETEKGVMQAVEALHGVKTLIIVAHRLSTVANCDVLYRLDHGRLVQTGSFNELVAS